MDGIFQLHGRHSTTRDKRAAQSKDYIAQKPPGPNSCNWLGHLIAAVKEVSIEVVRGQETLASLLLEEIDPGGRTYPTLKLSWLVISLANVECLWTAQESG